VAGIIALALVAHETHPSSRTYSSHEIVTLLASIRVCSWNGEGGSDGMANLAEVVAEHANDLTADLGGVSAPRVLARGASEAKVALVADRNEERRRQ
jgi:hypothetical protein